MKQKGIMYLCATSFVLNAVILIVAHDWSALLWLCCALLLSVLLESAIRQQDKAIRQRDDLINLLFDDHTYSYLASAERRIACAEDNVRRYQLENQKLKAENEQLKVLNHNLLTHQSKKRHGKQRH